MAKCFITGIDLQASEAWLLDRGAVKRALRDLKDRLAAVERIAAQLSPVDKTEFFDPKSKTTRTVAQRRLVCATVAQALAASYPEAALFIAWREFLKRKPADQGKSSRSKAPPQPRAGEGHADHA
jgi:hypothetical protein